MRQLINRKIYDTRSNNVNLVSSKCNKLINHGFQNEVEEIYFDNNKKQFFYYSGSNSHKPKNRNEILLLSKNDVIEKLEEWNDVEAFQEYFL